MSTPCATSRYIYPAQIFSDNRLWHSASSNLPSPPFFKWCDWAICTDPYVPYGVISSRLIKLYSLTDLKFPLVQQKYSTCYYQVISCQSRSAVKTVHTTSPCKTWYWCSCSHLERLWNAVRLITTSRPSLERWFGRQFSRTYRRTANSACFLPRSAEWWADLKKTRGWCSSEQTKPCGNWIWHNNGTGTSGSSHWGLFSF